MVGWGVQVWVVGGLVVGVVWVVVTAVMLL